MLTAHKPTKISSEKYSLNMITNLYLIKLAKLHLMYYYIF